MKSVAFTFGRFNPPTIGHERLMWMTRRANKNYRIYASQSQDSKKNPLNFKNKVAIMKSMFPSYARKISTDKMTTAIDVMVNLYNEKYTDVLMVVGSDRVVEFDALLKKYNGKRARHGFYKFKSIRVVSAGERDPDAEGVSGMSASKMRKAAQDNDYKSFQKGLPPKFKQGRLLFTTLQKEMGIKSLKEWMEFKEVSPPRWGHTVPDKPKGAKVGGTAQAMKKAQARGDIPKDMNIYALMWSMKNKGDKPHYKPGEKDVLKKKYKGKDGENEATEVKFNPLPKKKDKGPTPADQLLPKNASRSITAEFEIEGFKDRLYRKEFEAAAKMYGQLRKKKVSTGNALHRAASSHRHVSDRGLQTYINSKTT
jgi:hypothetical protein